MFKAHSHNIGISPDNKGDKIYMPDFNPIAMQQFSFHGSLKWSFL